MSDDLISQLRNLKAGVTVVYHQGWYLGTCPSKGRFLWPRKRESDSVVG
jgi:hypothetical protein